MKYYTIDPDTGDKELVAETVTSFIQGSEYDVDWIWAVDPRAVRLNERVVDENGVEYFLSDLIKGKQ